MVDEVATSAFTDIHCHLLPALDDGSRSWQETLAMAQIAIANGTDTIVVTPHQLGSYERNSGDTIRQATRQLADFLRANDVPLRVLPGADVRIEAELGAKLRLGTVLSLADQRKHVLLELPHELYFPLEPLLQELDNLGMHGILSHPERNQGLLAQPRVIEGLVADGCLMQITAGSIVGSFGPASQQLSEWMIQRGFAHFVASDAHGASARRPSLRRAYTRVAQLAGKETADELFCHNPAAVASGHKVATGRRPMSGRRTRRWFGKSVAA